MKKLGRGSWLAALVAAGILLGTGGTSHALEPGDVAPAFEGDEFINTEAFGLPDLRGRIIFFEVFRTW